MKIKTIGCLLALIVASQVCFGETTRSHNEKSAETVLIRVPGGDAVFEGPVARETHLSNAFVVAALRSASTLREWQTHLSITIQRGYPPSEYWIGADRDRAADALRLARLAASSDADKQVVDQLTTEFGTMDDWSNECMEGYKNLRMAKYYMSPAGLQNDETFQQSAQCTQTLLTVLAQGEVTEQPLCR